jgi:trimethylamine--corrinoid protein Co-methyltransferase
MSDDLVGWIRRYCQGFDVNRETLALEVIAELGPEGDYLGSEHTARHFREDWYPRLFDRHHYDRWAQEGGLSLRARAARRVEELLASHRPPPLEAGLRQKIDGLLG